MNSDVEKIWKDFWEPIVGQDLEKIKLELYDYYTALQEVTRVYYTLTNGAISKINTDSSVVLSVIEDQINKDTEEAVKDAIEDFKLKGA
jgi:hypothetical protein